MKSLPRGIRVDHGYCQVRLFIDGRMYCKNFGKDSDFARELAMIHLAEKRKEILMGRCGITKELPELSFKEAANIYYDHWSKEVDPNGNPRHNVSSCYSVRNRLEVNIMPYFEKIKIHEIRPKDIESWRMARLRRVCGSTANREQTILGSIFSHLELWINGEKIKAFKLPSKNPCLDVEKSSLQKRERIVTSYEISKLKLAARELKDENGKDNIALAVKTCLSFKDLRTLKLGDIVNLNRSKTGTPVHVPITVMHNPDWTNWRGRWEAIRAKAGLLDVEWRDLRKAGGNLLLGKHDLKLISLYMGHADQKTTESFYTRIQASQMQALAQDLSSIVDSL